MKYFIFLAKIVCHIEKLKGIIYLLEGFMGFMDKSGKFSINEIFPATFCALLTKFYSLINIGGLILMIIIENLVENLPTDVIRYNTDDEKI